MQKSTVRTHSDIALIKYWGKRDAKLRLPENNSISMSLDALHTTTTVAFDDEIEQDEVVVDGKQDEQVSQRVTKHLDRIRAFTGVELAARVHSKNNFPSSTGLSSSGSAFAALTLAALDALDFPISDREKSILARFGSGSAARCVQGGFVEWYAADSSEDSFAETVYQADHWDIRDCIVIVDSEDKRVPTTAAHRSAGSSPFFNARQKHLPDKLQALRTAIAEEDTTAFFDIVWRENFEFHSILQTSRPPYLTWRPATVAVLQLVATLRNADIPVAATINTGHNVHVLMPAAYQEQVETALSKLGAGKIISSSIGNGPTTLSTHLF